MTDREKHISVLQNIDRAYRTFTQEEYRALEYAIASLKTDLKYDLMYEGEEAYTKADLVAMLTDIQLEFEACVDGGEGSPQFEQGVDISRCQVVDIIQQKINALKGENNGNR